MRLPMIPIFLAALAACSGSIDPTDGRNGASASGAGRGSTTSAGGHGAGTAAGGFTGAGEVVAAGPAGVRRLAAVELRNSLSDLFFGGAELPASIPELPPDFTPHKFDTRDASLAFSSSFGEALLDWGEAAGLEVAKNANSIAPCASGVDESTCVAKFLTAKGPRVFRRPLTADETNRLASVYATARAIPGASYADAIGALVATMVQSPQFLYRSELGAQAGIASTPLTAYEAAAALSFLATRSTPDDELLAAAREDRLTDAEALVTQLRRLLATPRGRSAMADFVLQWIEVPQLDRVTKDATAYPDFGPELVTSMKADLAVAVAAVAAGSARLGDLFTTDAGMVDARLAKPYGAAAGARSLGVARAGVFTRGGFLAGHLPPHGFSPVFIGRYVRQRVFCQALGEPPPNVPPVAQPAPNVTTRERFRAHDDSAACSACHKLMDPIGFGFERYDSVGRYATTENTTPLTGEGRLDGTDVDGLFTGPAELGAKLAKSEQVRRCFAANLFEYALGRDFALADDRSPAEDRALEAATASGGDRLSDLLAAVVTNPAFVTRDATRIPGGAR